ncbi:MAG: hypothetical protein ACHQVS_04920 [Candidatus Babeliales bacterium]
MVISNYLRYLIIASLTVSLPVHPMGSLSIKTKIGIGLVATLAVFMGYRVWGNRKDRQELRQIVREAVEKVVAEIKAMDIYDSNDANKIADLQDVRTKQLFNSINYLGLLINGQDWDRRLLDRIKTVLEYPAEHRANPDMTYQDLKAKITYSILDLSCPASRSRGDEMPLEERPITLLAKKLMPLRRDQLGLGFRLQLIQLVHGYSKLPLDVTDHKGDIRRIMYMDSNDAALIASLNQRRQSRRDTIYDTTFQFPYGVSDIIFCYDDPLMANHPIPLKSGNAALASWSAVPKQLTVTAGEDEEEIIKISKESLI